MVVMSLTRSTSSELLIGALVCTVLLDLPSDPIRIPDANRKIYRELLGGNPAATTRSDTSPTNLAGSQLDYFASSKKRASPGRCKHSSIVLVVVTSLVLYDQFANLLRIGQFPFRPLFQVLDLNNVLLVFSCVALELKVRSTTLNYVSYDVRAANVLLPRLGRVML